MDPNESTVKDNKTLEEKELSDAEFILKHKIKVEWNPGMVYSVIMPKNFFKEEKVFNIEEKN